MTPQILQIINHFDNLDWHTINNESDVNVAYSQFINEFKQAYEKFSPKTKTNTNR